MNPYVVTTLIVITLGIVPCPGQGTIAGKRRAEDEKALARMVRLLEVEGDRAAALMGLSQPDPPQGSWGWLSDRSAPASRRVLY